MRGDLMQVAQSNSKSPNKLADKYLDGKAGGFYGIGGKRATCKVFQEQDEEAQAVLHRHFSVIG
jgi:hypothetical protein